MPTVGPLEIFVILIACTVPAVLIAGLIAFVVWVIRWRRGKQDIVIPPSDESRPAL
jgi:hypothetical protein